MTSQYLEEKKEKRRSRTDGAEGDLRLAKDGRLTGEDDIAGHGKLTASTKCVSVDGSNERLAELGERVPLLKHVGLVRLDKVPLGHLFFFFFKGSEEDGEDDEENEKMKVRPR